MFPKKCVNCGKDGGYVCEEGSVGMWEEEQICPSCRRASRYGLRHKYCRGDMDGLTCLWAYEGIARKIIANAKYKYFYDQLGELIKLEERTEFEFLRRFLETRPKVVPVPLHPKRLRERGFNQAEKIANYEAGIMNLEVKNLLIRIKDTQQQVGRSREERLNAMENAFVVNRNSLFEIPDSILLVDDVWTTGATMSECAKVLRQNGAERIWGLVLAR